jgi:hypothetical protein
LMNCLQWLFFAAFNWWMDPKFNFLRETGYGGGLFNDENYRAGSILFAIFAFVNLAAVFTRIGSRGRVIFLWICTLNSAWMMPFGVIAVLDHHLSLKEPSSEGE